MTAPYSQKSRFRIFTLCLIFLLCGGVGYNIFAQDGSSSGGATDTKKNPDKTPNEKTETPKTCDKCDPNSSNNCTASAMISISLHNPYPWSGSESAKLIMDVQSPTLLSYSPMAVKFSRGPEIIHFANQNQNQDPEYITLRTQDGLQHSFRFAGDNSSVAPMEGREDTKKQRLIMVNAQGQSVQSSPTYYELHTGNGMVYRYHANANSFGQLVHTRDEQGRVVSNDNAGYEVIRGVEGEISQIMTPSRLVIVQNVDDDSFRIDHYQLSDVEDVKIDGVYVLKDEDNDTIPDGSPFQSHVISNPQPGTLTKVRHTETKLNEIHIADFTYQPSTQTWDMVEHSGAPTTLKDEKQQIWNEDLTVLITQQWMRDTTFPGRFSMVEMEQHKINGEMLLVRESKDPEDLNLTQTFTHYLEASTGYQNRVKSKTSHDGSWVSYVYDAKGRTVLELMPWLNAPVEAPDNPANVIDQGDATLFEYAPLDPADTLIENDQRPRTITRKVLGKVVSRKYYVYGTGVGGARYDRMSQAHSPSAAYNDPKNLTTTRYYFGPQDGAFLEGRLKQILRPDGQTTTYNYERGNWDEQTQVFTANANGFYFRTTQTHGTENNSNGIANETTQEIQIQNASGYTIRTEQLVYTGTAYELLQWTQQEFDIFGQMTLSENSRGEVTTMVKRASCCGADEIVNAQGIKQTTTYDALNRPIARAKVGAIPAKDQIVEYTLDPAGNILMEEKRDGAASLSLITTYSYDGTNRRVNTDFPNGSSIQITYLDDLRITVRTKADGSDVITERYLNGRTKSITGSGAVHQYYEYGVNDDGTRWTKAFTGPDGAASPMWVLSTTNMLGQNISSEQPGHNGGLVFTLQSYDDAGRLETSESFAYTQAELTTAFPQPVEWAVGPGATLLAPVNDAFTYGQSNPSTEAASTLALAMENDRYASLILKPQVGSMNLRDKTFTFQIHRRNWTSNRRYALFSSINGFEEGDQLFDSPRITTRTPESFQITFPDTVEYESISGGLELRMYGYAGQWGVSHPTSLPGYGLPDLPEVGVTLNTTVYEYNSLSEVIQVAQDMDHNGTIQLDDIDRIQVSESEYVKLLGDWWKESKSYIYDEGNAVPTLVSTSRQRFTGLGGDVAQKGFLVSETVSIDIHGNENISRRYLDRDNLTALSEQDGPFSDIDTQSINVNGLTLSQKSSTGLTTIYDYDALERQVGITDPRTGRSFVIYEEVTGLMTSQTDAAGNTTTIEYDDLGRQISVTDPENNVSYTGYTDDGQVRATWGAGYPVVYEYDDYDRMIRLHTLRDPQVVFNPTVDDDGIITSTVAGLTASMDTTIWTYEESTGLLLSKKHDDNKGPDYTYSSDGKLLTRTWARGTVTTYGYDLDTQELLTITYSDGTPTVTNEYDRLGRIEKNTDAFGVKTYIFDDKFQNTSEDWDGLQINTLTRKYDAQGRALGVKLNGITYETTYTYSAQGRFDTITHAPSTYVTDYTYLADSELTSGYTLGDFEREVTFEVDRNLVDIVTNTYDVTNPSTFDYSNDDSGRRTGRSDSGAAFASTQVNTFGYNARNEVTSTTMRNGNSTYSFDQIGNRIEVSVPGEPQPLDFSTNALNQYTDIEGDTPVYDDDGNLTDDDKGKTFTWNGENRMVSATIGTTTVENTYDSQGRRVRKIVKVSGVMQKDIRYLYDGWNLLYEIDLESTDPTRYYVWGLDLSQSMQGAGGVGGLLFTSSGSDAHAVSYDANGNISEYVDLSDGSIDAHLEYDAFGRIIASTGTVPSTFGFSTKYQDTETGYLYYGFRYYDPETGRWPNRDPIEEQGGYNLYGFVGNYPIWGIDVLGLQLKWKVMDGVDVATAYAEASKALRGGKATDLMTRTGFEVWYEGNCICPDGLEGEIILVQELWKKKKKGKGEEWQVDDFMGEGKYSEPREEKCGSGEMRTLQPGYRENGGCPSNRRGHQKNGYIDSPTYSQKVKVTAYCRCECEDDKELESIEFNITR